MQKHQDSFRRATLKDIPKIVEITDAAYNSVEIGQTGLAFRLENTFRSHHMFEPDHRSDIDHFFILKNEQNIVGAVGAKVDENLETVEIGPLAVDPNHQVRKKILNYLQSHHLHLIFDILKFKIVSLMNWIFAGYTGSNGILLLKLFFNLL